MTPSSELSERINAIADEWHDTALGEMSLPEYLGLTCEQYDAWFREGVLPDDYELPDRDGYRWLKKAVAIVVLVYGFAELMHWLSRHYLTGGR